jgi:hypothetical protein
MDATAPCYTFLDDRMKRAYSQNIRLVYVEQSDAETSRFIVRGVTGNLYTVSLKGLWEHECNCPDYQARQSSCKHIYFIKLVALKGRDHTKSEIIPALYAPEYMVTALKPHAARIMGSFSLTKKVKRRNYVGSDCAICLNPMHEKTPTIWCTQTCGNSVHETCHNEWISKHGKTCVYCKTDWASGNHDHGFYFNTGTIFCHKKLRFWFEQL